MICQRTTCGVVHVFTSEGFSANVCLDDFYGAEFDVFADVAFLRLQELLDELGLATSPQKASSPSTSMVCLGIHVDTQAFTLKVPEFRVTEVFEELQSWLSRRFFTKQQLQSLLGKSSFITACVKPGRIFMARLLNNLCSFPPSTHVVF